MPRPIEFLTREGCAQTATMRGHLDAAIRATGQPIRYGVVDLDTLPATDHRRGYPTPTILIGGEDMFGMGTAPPLSEAPT